MLGNLGKAKKWAAAMLAALAFGVSAQAGLIPVQVTVTPDGGDFRWTYAVIVTTDVQVNPGDSFTIYDFAGFVNGSLVMPANWTASTAMSGPPRPGTNPVDLPGETNLTFTYTGSAILGSAGLGNFWAISEYSTVGTGDFTSSSHRQIDGRLENNITATDVPVFVQDPPVNETPEPTSLALLGLGLPLAGAVTWWRRRKQA